MKAAPSELFPRFDVAFPYGSILDVAAVLLIIAAFLRTDEVRGRIVLGGLSQADRLMAHFRKGESG